MPYVNHTVIAEDTLPKLAQRYLGDASRWQEIAILNELEYPFIVNEFRSAGTPKTVKAIGETLLIPLEESIEDAPLYELQEGYDRLLGEDIDLISSLLNEYGDTFLNFTEGEQAEMFADAHGDIRTVKGLRNLQQALLLRLMTPQGSLLHHPDYGSQIHDLIGKPETPNLLQKIKIELERTIRSDERVEDVVISDVTSEGGVVRATIQIKPIGLDKMFELGLNLNLSGVITWA